MNRKLSPQVIPHKLNDQNALLCTIFFKGYTEFHMLGLISRLISEQAVRGRISIRSWRSDKDLRLGILGSALASEPEPYRQKKQWALIVFCYKNGG